MPNTIFRFSPNLQSLRRSHDLSQEALALLVEIDRGYVGIIENAHYSVSVGTIKQLASAPDVDRIELFKHNPKP